MNYNSQVIELRIKVIATTNLKHSQVFITLRKGLCSQTQRIYEKLSQDSFIGFLKENTLKLRCPKLDALMAYL